VHIRNLISLSTAGGGKTTKLISRVNEILQFDSAEKILIISFTNASCRDILERSKIKAETLHSFCYKFLPENYNIEEDISRFTNIFLSNFFHLSKLGEIEVNRLLNSYFISRKFPNTILPLTPKDLTLNEEFRELVNLITEEKRNHGCLFFSDIIHEFTDLLDDFLINISQMYNHILIDEAQDLSEIQLKIIAKIIENVFLEENKSFFIVGDVKQSIYDFQGASPDAYLNFIEGLKSICQSKKLVLDFENNNKTYRFGGEILDKINSKFEQHHSDNNEGNYCQVIIDDKSYIESCVIKIIEKYLFIEGVEPKNIMILFERNNSIIENLQNKLINFGLNIKIYTKDNAIINALRDVVCYLQTGSNFFVAKILQGPFFYLTEPHFFLINQFINDHLISYNQEFFDQISALRFYPDLLIKYLAQKVVTCSPIDSKILSYLYNMSFAFSSMDSLIIAIPELIKLQENGIQFSTIHSSKGLEADLVIVLPVFHKSEKLTMNLDPFFFFYDNINDFTQYILDERRKKQTQNRNNLSYVALTRAKKYLYEIIISSIDM
jgi:ATP-dependent exoDNAse (exonuclease V) beta subunit